MYELMALELMRQRRDETARLAERARLERRARQAPRRRGLLRR